MLPRLSPLRRSAIVWPAHKRAAASRGRRRPAPAMLALSKRDKLAAARLISVIICNHGGASGGGGQKRHPWRAAHNIGIAISLLYLIYAHFLRPGRRRNRAEENNINAYYIFIASIGKKKVAMKQISKLNDPYFESKCCMAPSAKPCFRSAPWRPNTEQC